MRKQFDILILLLMVVFVIGCATSQTPQTGVYSYSPYTAALVQQGAPGRLMLRIQVAEDGTLTAVKCEQSSGFSALDQYAAAWVMKNWHYPPGKAGSYRVPFEFKQR
jgi:TonB family protein